MIRMHNRNSSCDCGRATKERGSFVTKSKVYETRSGAQRPQEDNITSASGVKDDVRINSSKEDKELLLKKMEPALISVPPINKSLNFRRSSANLSKTSTNKPCDNKKVVANGNARSLTGDALDDIKVTNTKELKLDDLECNCVRSNMNFEDSHLGDGNNVPLTENNVEPEKALGEDKQNGVCEKCVKCGGGDRKLSCSCHQKSEKTQNSTGNSNTSLEGNGSGLIVNGYLNGNKHLHKDDENLDFDFIKDEDIVGKSCRDEVENSDLGLNDRREKKRKSNFEKIFDSYAELGCLSDKRRSRRPPESYSPEPSRRIKLENLFDADEKVEEKIIPPTPVSAKVKKKPVRKPRQKGPIFHYLDLYIKNKDIKRESLKQEVPEEPLIDPSLIKQEEEDTNIEESQVAIESLNGEESSPIVVPSSSPILSPSSSVPLPQVEVNNDTEISKTSTSNFEYSKHEQSEINLKNNITDASCSTVEKVHCYETVVQTSQVSEVLPPRSIPCSRVPPIPMPTIPMPPIPMSSDELCNENCTGSVNLKKKTKVVNNKHKKARKEKPKELMYDADVSRILGYRHNKGKNEFLVLFHNGTSNWVIQDNNITIIDPYKEYFEHSEHELSTINRLAYFIMINSMRDNDDESCSDTELISPSSCKEHNGTIPSMPLNVSSVPTSNGSAIDNKECSVFSSNGPLISCNDSVEESVKESTVVINNESSLCSDLDLHIDTSPVNNCISNVNYIQNALSAGYNETMSKSDLNELCNYVMSSRHIKLYPFETNKEVVFKRDDEFMHIYLKNIRKNPDDPRRVDDHLDMRSCEKLIYTLEDCAVDDTCKVVVISGIEEYFALKNIFDKLLKKPATIEGKNYEQDVSMLRYLIQTIRNFTKPICAVIKKTATGLPASMLSLFDMVFDERGENFVAKKPPANPKPAQKKPKEKPSKKKKVDKKIDPPPTTVEDPPPTRVKDMNAENFQSYLFPRLMGLTESNESQIMGEGQKLTDFNDTLSCSYYNKRMLSVQLRKSLRHMKSNTKIQMKNRGRNQSLNSEEDFEEIVTEQFHCGVSTKPSVIIQENIDNLEKEIEREKELTKRSMDELESILHSMEPC